MAPSFFVDVENEGEYFSAKRTTYFGPLKHQHFSGSVSCGFVECFLRFCCEKMRMLRGSNFARSFAEKY